MPRRRRLSTARIPSYECPAPLSVLLLLGHTPTVRGRIITAKGRGLGASVAEIRCNANHLAKTLSETSPTI